MDPGSLPGDPSRGVERLYQRTVCTERDVPTRWTFQQASQTCRAEYHVTRCIVRMSVPERVEGPREEVRVEPGVEPGWS